MARSCFRKFKSFSEAWQSLQIDLGFNIKGILELHNLILLFYCYTNNLEQFQQVSVDSHGLN